MLTIIAAESLLAAIWTYVGWQLHKHKNVNYKERWQLASKLLEEERTKTLALNEHSDPGPAFTAAKDLVKVSGKPLSRPLGPPPLGRPVGKELAAYKAKKAAVASATTLRLLHKMDGQQRFDVEGARLRNNLAVVDDLDGLGTFWTAEMLKRRARHGIG